MVLRYHNPGKSLQEEVGFYADLYSSKCKQDSYAEVQKLFLSNDSIPRLDREAKDICNEPLTLQDLSNALTVMTPDKSAGPDGLITNFFVFGMT